ncbi:MAG: RNA polymerase sigma factor [Candidatus Kapaibacterium sp.]
MSFLLDEEQQRFLMLLEPVRPGLARYCRAISSDRETARDLVSETILIAYEHFASMNSDGKSFSSYLFTTATRLHKRWRWRGKRKVAYDAIRAAEIIDTNPAPDSGADIELLYAALRRLPEAQREAVVMFEISGLTLEEIRQIQGGSLSGVKSRIARGREKLAKSLGANLAPRNVIAATPPVPSGGAGYQFANVSVRRNLK